MNRVGVFLNICILTILTTLITGSKIETSSPPVVLWHGMGKKNN